MGHVAFWVMAFGLTNAPATFQRLMWGPCQGLATLNLRHPSHLRPTPRQDSSCSPMPTQGGDTKSFFLLSSNHLPWLQPFRIMFFSDIVVITRVHSTNQGRLAGVLFPPWFMDTNAFFLIFHGHNRWYFPLRGGLLTTYTYPIPSLNPTPNIAKFSVF